MSFEEMTQRKTEQLSLDFSDRGEARKRWSKGRLVSWADEPGRAETPAAPALAEGLIEAMLSGKKVETALREVETNKGAPGVDGMSVKELRPYLRINWTRLKEDLLEGKYRPKPVRRVSKPKPDGGPRELGVPTAVDRFIQQMIL